MATSLTGHRATYRAAQTLRLASSTIPLTSICVRCQVSLFSASASRAGPNGDRNKKRGVSALRRTGVRYPSAVSSEPLPVPVMDPARRSKLKINEKHGLWQFFDKERKPFEPPTTVAAHGRPWAVEELRHKSFEDLHCLWWVCVKERNRLITQERERGRVDAGFGLMEFEDRDKAVKITMRAIRHVLTERWYSYEEARKIAQQDPKLQHVFSIDEDVAMMDEDAFEEEDSGANKSEGSMFTEQQQQTVEVPTTPRTGSRIVKEPVS